MYIRAGDQGLPLARGHREELRAEILMMTSDELWHPERQQQQQQPQQQLGQEHQQQPDRLMEAGGSASANSMWSHYQQRPPQQHSFESNLPWQGFGGGMQPAVSMHGTGMGVSVDVQQQQLSSQRVGMGTQLQQQQPPSLVGRSMQPAASMHGAGMGVGVDGQQQRPSSPRVGISAQLQQHQPQSLLQQPQPLEQQHQQHRDWLQHQPPPYMPPWGTSGTAPAIQMPGLYQQQPPLQPSFGPDWSRQGVGIGVQSASVPAGVSALPPGAYLGSVSVLDAAKWKEYGAMQDVGLFEFQSRLSQAPHAVRALFAECGVVMTSGGFSAPFAVTQDWVMSLVGEAFRRGRLVTSYVSPEKPSKRQFTQWSAGNMACATRLTFEDDAVQQHHGAQVPTRVGHAVSQVYGAQALAASVPEVRAGPSGSLDDKMRQLMEVVELSLKTTQCMGAGMQAGGDRKGLDEEKPRVGEIPRPWKKVPRSDIPLVGEGDSLEVTMDKWRSVLEKRPGEGEQHGYTSVSGLVADRDKQQRVDIIGGKSITTVSLNFQHYVAALLKDRAAQPGVLDAERAKIYQQAVDFTMGLQNLLAALAGKSGYGGHEGDEGAQLNDLLVIIRYAFGMSLDPRQLSLRTSLGFTMTPVQVRGEPSRVDATPAVPKSRPPRAVGVTWPTAAAHLGVASGVVKKSKCRGCDELGHDLFECPKHFFEVYGVPMPGYDRNGGRVQHYWHDGQEANGPAKAIASAWVRHVWKQDAELDGPDHVAETWRRLANRPQ